MSEPSMRSLPAPNPSTAIFTLFSVGALSAACNTGFFSYIFVLAFTVGLLRFAKAESKFRLPAAGILVVGAALISAHTLWPTLYVQHIGDELINDGPRVVCNMSDPAGTSYIVMKEYCSSFEAPKTLPRGTYKVVGVVYRSARYWPTSTPALVLDTPAGKAVVISLSGNMSWNDDRLSYFDTNASLLRGWTVLTGWLMPLCALAYPLLRRTARARPS